MIGTPMNHKSKQYSTQKQNLYPPRFKFHTKNLPRFNKKANFALTFPGSHGKKNSKKRDESRSLKPFSPSHGRMPVL